MVLKILNGRKKNQKTQKTNSQENGMEFKFQGL